MWLPLLEMITVVPLVVCYVTIGIAERLITSDAATVSE